MDNETSRDQGKIVEPHPRSVAAKLGWVKRRAVIAAALARNALPD